MAGFAEEGHKLFVDELPLDVMKEELHTVFSTYGQVTDVTLMEPSQRGVKSAYVTYAKVESAEDAIKVLDNIYKIREDAVAPIKVTWAPKAEASKPMEVDSSNAAGQSGGMAAQSWGQPEGGASAGGGGGSSSAGGRDSWEGSSGGGHSGGGGGGE